ncbi:MAG: hypothetical protein IJR83_00545, partial [Clostridia bacterium]|nr:hypothetical protein [Clostridia bacterium]
EWFGGIADTIRTVIQEALDNLKATLFDTLLRGFYERLYGALTDLFSSIGNIGSSLFDLTWVQAALHFFSLFGMGLWLAGSVIAVFHLVLDAQSGHMPPFRRGLLPILSSFLFAMLFARLPVELYRFCTDLQGVFAKGLLSLTGAEAAEPAKAALSALPLFSAPHGANPLLPILGLLCVAYCTIRCFLANLKRGAILFIQIAVGSLHVFSMPRGENGGWLVWCRRVAGLCFTAFLQTTMLLLGLATLQTHVLLGLGVLLGATEVPRIADQFGLDTSIRASLSGAVRNTSMAINLIRTAAML